MSRIRSRNTRPEIFVRSILHRMGYRFTISGPLNRSLPGRPDIVLPRHRTVIFVHGCFWHRHEGCRDTTTPKTRTGWWVQKFVGNTARDQKNQLALRNAGWNVAVVWECEVNNPETLSRTLTQWIQRIAAYITPVDREAPAARAAEDASDYRVKNSVAVVRTRGRKVRTR